MQAHLKSSIHLVSACEPRPSAASIAALNPHNAWSLDMTPLVRGARSGAQARHGAGEVADVHANERALFCSGQEVEQKQLRRGCRRNEASLKAACGSGCDARRLSTGGSIRAEGYYAGGQSVRAIRRRVRLRGTSDDFRASLGAGPKIVHPEFWGEVQPPASLKGLDIPSRRAVFVPSPSRLRPLETEQKAGVRNGKPDFSLRNQSCRRGCTSRRNSGLRGAGRELRRRRRGRRVRVRPGD
jgi:hypothetical protein